MEHRFLEMCHLVQIDMGRFHMNKTPFCIKQRNHLAYANQMKLPFASEFCETEEPGEMYIVDVTDSQFASLTFCCMYWTIVRISADDNLGHLWLRIQCSDAELTSSENPSVLNILISSRPAKFLWIWTATTRSRDDMKDPG